jgi:hypothetical protein
MLFLGIACGEAKESKNFEPPNYFYLSVLDCKTDACYISLLLIMSLISLS